MEESQQDQMVIPDETTEPVDPAVPEEPADAVEPVESAAPVESSEPEEAEEKRARPESIEAEIEGTLTRTKIISRLKAIVVELEGGSLVIEGVPVAELADEVGFELDYSEKDGKHELEIELEW
jgi:amphi-Trp domain-containing protein